MDFSIKNSELKNDRKIDIQLALEFHSNCKSNVFGQINIYLLGSLLNNIRMDVRSFWLHNKIYKMRKHTILYII